MTGAGQVLETAPNSPLDMKAVLTVHD